MNAGSVARCLDFTCLSDGQRVQNSPIKTSEKDTEWYLIGWTVRKQGRRLGGQGDRDTMEKAKDSFGEPYPQRRLTSQREAMSIFTTSLCPFAVAICPCNVDVTARSKELLCYGRMTLNGREVERRELFIVLKIDVAARSKELP